MVQARLRELVGKTKSLTAGASAAGARVHRLPGSPRDVPDDGEFRYLILGPEAVSDSGKPSPTAQAFLDHTTGPDRPRVHRNALVAAAPSRVGLEAARAKVRSLLGWEDVAGQLARQAVDPLRAERLRRQTRAAARDVPGVIRQAYGIVATVDEANQVQAFKLPGSAEPLFAQIKDDRRSRITDTPVNPEALLPDGPYDLWREGEESRFANQLAGSFARYPYLPKVLRPKLVAETVLAGVRQGLFVARLPRPDGSARTWWRESVDPVAAEDPSLEIVLPQKARLARLNERLLAPGRLPGLWKGEGEDQALPVATLLRYFAGGRVVAVPKNGYEEHEAMPACDADGVLEAVALAVERGIVWVTNPPATAWKEPVPAGTLNDAAALHPPPTAVTPQDLSREAVPTAWTHDRTNGLALTQALSQQRSAAVPWGLVRDGIGAAVNGRWLVLTDRSEPVDSPFDRAAGVVLEQPRKDAAPKATRPGRPSAVLDVSQLQDLAEGTPRLLDAVGGSELAFHVRVEVKGRVGDAARARVDAILEEVSEDLKSG